MLFHSSAYDWCDVPLEQWKWRHSYVMHSWQKLVHGNKSNITSNFKKALENEVKASQSYSKKLESFAKPFLFKKLFSKLFYIPSLFQRHKSTTKRQETPTTMFLLFVFAQRICIHHQNCCVWCARIRSAILGIWWCMPKQRTWWIFMKSENRTRKTIPAPTARVIN